MFMFVSQCLRGDQTEGLHQLGHRTECSWPDRKPDKEHEQDPSCFHHGAGKGCSYIFICILKMNCIFALCIQDAFVHQPNSVVLSNTVLQCYLFFCILAYIFIIFHYLLQRMSAKMVFNLYKFEIFMIKLRSWSQNVSFLCLNSIWSWSKLKEKNHLFYIWFSAISDNPLP